MCGVGGPPLAAAGQGVHDAVHGPNRPVVTAKPGALVAPASCHVLLVDDERLTRTVVANLLHKCGYRGAGEGGRDGPCFVADPQACLFCGPPAPHSCRDVANVVAAMVGGISRPFCGAGWRGPPPAAVWHWCRRRHGAHTCASSLCLPLQ